jgi:hypothetical protein
MKGTGAVRQAVACKQQQSDTKANNGTQKQSRHPSKKTTGKKTPYQ